MTRSDGLKLKPPSDAEFNTFGNLMTAVVCLAIGLLAGWSFTVSLLGAIAGFAVSALLWNKPRGLIQRLRGWHLRNDGEWPRRAD